MENECVDMQTKIEYMIKKKMNVKKKIEFLKQTIERLGDIYEDA